MQIARVISRRLSPSFSPSCCGTRVPTLNFRFPGTLYALRTSKFFPANIHVNAEGSYTCLSCNFQQTKLQGSFSPSSVQSISMQTFSKKIEQWHWFCQQAWDLFSPLRVSASSPKCPSEVLEVGNSKVPTVLRTHCWLTHYGWIHYYGYHMAFTLLYLQLVTNCRFVISFKW
jgi:hypothetical protein